VSSQPFFLAPWLYSPVDCLNCIRFQSVHISILENISNDYLFPNSQLMWSFVHLRHVSGNFPFIRNTPEWRWRWWPISSSPTGVPTFRMILTIHAMATEWKSMISHTFLMHTLFLFLIGWFMVLRWSVPLSRNISPSGASPCRYGSMYLGRTKTNRDVNSTRELSGWLNDRFTKIPVPWFEPSMIPNPTLPWIWRYVPGEQRHGRCLWQLQLKYPLANRSKVGGVLILLQIHDSIYNSTTFASGARFCCVAIDSETRTFHLHTWIES